MKVAEQILKEGNYNLNKADIKREIDLNNQLIESLLKPNEYTLNNSVAKLLEANAALQSKCTHEFEDGYCIFCYMEDPNHDN